MKLARWLRDLRNTVDGLYIVDAQQRIILWNKGAERILGYSESEVLQKHCYAVVQGKARSGKLLCQPGCTVSWCVQRGGLPRNMNVLTRTKQGREVWVNASLIVLPHKTSPLTVHLLRDISRQERLEQAASQFADTVRASGVMEKPNGANNGDCSCVATSDASSNHLCALSPRELEVVRLLSEGLSTENISHRLEISRCTVRNHVQHILSKLAVRTKSQAVAYAFRAGLL